MLRKNKQPAAKPALAPLGGFRFQMDPPKPQPKLKRVRAEKPKVKINPQLIAKARELRDRCMERQDEWLRLAPGGKYDVSRALAAQSSGDRADAPLLPAA